MGIPSYKFSKDTHIQTHAVHSRTRRKMRVTIVLDGSDICTSTLKSYFSSSYNTSHQLELLYVMPKFAQKSLEKLSISQVKLAANESLRRLERYIQHNFLFSLELLPKNYCTFGISKSEVTSSESIGQAIAENSVRSVLDKFSEETPDAVVFACETQLQGLSDVLSDFGEFYMAAQNPHRRCSSISSSSTSENVNLIY